MSRFTDRLIAKTCLASSYDRISSSVEPPAANSEVALLLGGSSSPIVNNHWNAIDYLVRLVLCLLYSHLVFHRCLPSLQKNRGVSLNLSICSSLTLNLGPGRKSLLGYELSRLWLKSEFSCFVRSTSTEKTLLASLINAINKAIHRFTQ